MSVRVCMCLFVCLYLESIGAGAAIVVHRVIGAGAIILAGVGKAGLTLSLDIYIYWT